MESLVQDVDWYALAPALVVAVGSLAVLVADLMLPAQRHGALRWLTLAVIVGAGVLVVIQSGTTSGTFCSDDGTGLLSCSFVADSVTRAFQGIALAAAALVTLLPADGPREADGRLSGEYHFLLLASLAGAVSLAGARDLLTVVVALEVLSLPAFAMVALPAGRGPDRSTADGRAAEGALKAFLFSVVALAVMVVGIALLYGATGTLHLERISGELVAGTASEPVAAVGAALTLAGLLFKVAAVPFHGWVPDSYAGAPVRVAAYLSTVSKAGGFAGLSVVLWYGLRPYGLAWGPVLAVIAAATMTVGNLGALRQTEPVRLLAWSSIAQSGFMLVPLAAAGVSSSSGAVDRDGAAATVAYLAVYVVLNLGAFAVVALVTSSRAAPVATPARVPATAAKAGVRAETPAVRGRVPARSTEPGVPGLTEYRGIARVAALPALALAFCLVGLAGLPPAVAGLLAKVVVFGAAVDAGLGWLGVVMAVNVVLGLAYYLRWAALLFALPGEVAPVRPGGPAAAATSLAVTLAVVTAAALSIWPEATLQLL